MKQVTERVGSAALRASIPRVHRLVTEGEPWDATWLGMLNAILDTIHPGLRLALVYDKDRDSSEGGCRMIVMRYEHEERARHLPTVLREIADQIEVLDA